MNDYWIAAVLSPILTVRFHVVFWPCFVVGFLALGAVMGGDESRAGLAVGLMALTAAAIAHHFASKHLRAVKAASARGETVGPRRYRIAEFLAAAFVVFVAWGMWSVNSKDNRIRTQLSEIAATVTPVEARMLRDAEELQRLRDDYRQAKTVDSMRKSLKELAIACRRVSTAFRRDRLMLSKKQVELGAAIVGVSKRSRLREEAERWRLNFENAIRALEEACKSLDEEAASCERALNAPEPPLRRPGKRK